MDNPKEKLKYAKMTTYCALALIPLALIRFLLMRRPSEEPLFVRVITGPEIMLVLGVLLLCMGLYMQRFWKARDKK